MRNAHAHARTQAQMVLKSAKAITKADPEGSATIMEALAHNVIALVDAIASIDRLPSSRVSFRPSASLDAGDVDHAVTISARQLRIFRMTLPDERGENSGH